MLKRYQMKNLVGMGVLLFSLNITIYANETLETIKGADIKSAIGLLATGQTISYMKGDDGYYQKGIKRNYTRDDSKEVVIDNITGLMWQDNREAKTVKKPWTTEKNADKDDMNSNGDTAITYCSNLTLGGYDDWRLPTIKELLSIVDNKKKNSATKDDIFRNIKLGYYYWSSTTFSDSNGAWSLKHYYGIHTEPTDQNNDGYYMEYNYKAIPYHVRCVRDVQ